MILNEYCLHTVDDIYALPEGQRAELIDGELIMMAPPSRTHQKIVSYFTQKIGLHIEQKQGSCEVYPAPFAVFLNADGKTYVEPDISVICDPDKLTDKGCNGAPDWVIEIVSPGSYRMDYLVKLFKYQTAGIKEYWIVNPASRTVTTYDFNGEGDAAPYSFDDAIPSVTLKDFTARLSDMDK